MPGAWRLRAQRGLGMQDVSVSREQVCPGQAPYVGGFSTPLRAGTTAVAKKCPQS